MRFGSSTLAGVPLAAPDFTSEAVESDETFLRNNPRLQRQHLVIASVVDSGGSPVTSGNQWSDIPSHLEEPFPARVAQAAIDFESSILTPQLDRGGLGRPSVGSIRILRGPQDSADFASWVWDGRPLVVKVGRPGAHLGEPGWTLSRFITALQAEVKTIRARTQDFTILLRDVGRSLREPLQGATYAGTGGVEGGSDLEGRTKPFCYGPNRNLRPRLVDSTAQSGPVPSNGVYQIHDRQIEAVTAVYDGGVPYTPHNDPNNDISDLALGAITDWDPTGFGGEYITDLANGLIRVATLPTRDITVDAQGDADASLGGYVSSTADLVERILRQRAGYTDSEINAGTFGRLNLDLPGAKGFYSESGDGSVESVLNAILQPLSWARFDELGRIEVGNLKRTTPSAILDGVNGTTVLDVQPKDDGPPPTHNLTLRYGKSWLIQRENSLLAGASDDQRSFVAEEYRSTTVTDAAVDSLHLASRELELDTLFESESDATSEATRLGALLAEDARRYEIDARHVQSQVKPGATIRLYWSDFGLSGGKDLIVQSVKENSTTARTRIVGWG